MADLIKAAQTRIGYAENELKSGDTDATAGHLAKAKEFLERASVAVAALVDMESDGNDPRFIVIEDPDQVYLIGGTEAGNPNGVSFTLGQARDWWQTVFEQDLNISKVRPTLLPGSHVLSLQGLAEARELGQPTNTNFAPEDFNPLELEVVV